MYISAPGAVRDLTVTPISSSQLTVTWTASKNAEVYSVSYRLIDLYQCGVSTLTHPLMSAGNITGVSTILSGLEPNSNYGVYVAAYNEFGCSAGSSQTGSTNGGPSMCNLLHQCYKGINSGSFDFYFLSLY